MDVQDGFGHEETHGMWEPPGVEEAHASADDGSGSAAGYDGPSTGHEESGGAADPGSGAGAGGSPAPGTDGGSTSGTMTVEIEGQTRELPAEKDYTGDGRPDAAAETPDGKVIVFADTEDNATGAAGPDGKADEAYIVDKQTGRVIGAAHVDPRTGEWVDDADADGPSAVSATPDGETGS
jgi:hypothetical protein